MAGRVENIGICILLLDPEDLAAFALDLGDVLARYGLDEEDCPPHLRKAREAEIDRATSTFRQCMGLVSGG